MKAPILTVEFLLPMIEQKVGSLILPILFMCVCVCVLLQKPSIYSIYIYFSFNFFVKKRQNFFPIYLFISICLQWTETRWWLNIPVTFFAAIAYFFFLLPTTYVINVILLKPRVFLFNHSIPKKKQLYPSFSIIFNWILFLL